MLTMETVGEALRLTFEEMAFLDIAPGRPAEAVSPDPAEEGPVLFLSYTRPLSGSFALYLPKAIKFQVAEAIYGEAWNSLSAAQLDDSLLELMNVLAGRLLTLRFGVASTYSMGLPTVLYDPPEDLQGQKTVFPFHLDENEFSLVWYEVPA
jgi:hypothetical protein